MDTITKLKALEKMASLEATVGMLHDENVQLRAWMRQYRQQRDNLEQSLTTILAQLVDEGRTIEMLTHPDAGVRDATAGIASQKKKWVGDADC